MTELENKIFRLFLKHYSFDEIAEKVCLDRKDVIKILRKILSESEITRVRVVDSGIRRLDRDDYYEFNL